MLRDIHLRTQLMWMFVCLILFLSTPRCRAEGTLIAAGGRIDMVHDFKSDIVYITNGSSILAYNVGTKTTLYRILVESGAVLIGIDLSPDGKTLAVADNRYANNQVWIWLIDTATRMVTKVAFAQQSLEGGAWTVAFGADGSVFFTTLIQGSGWVPLRRYFPATGTTQVVLQQVSKGTMITPSGDASIIGFAEASFSPGPVGRYRLSDGDVIRHGDYSTGAGSYVWEIGVNRDGSQYAVPTNSGTVIFDAYMLKTGIMVGASGQPMPMGVVYHPVEDLVYFAWQSTFDVRCFNTQTWDQTASYNFENYFDPPGNGAFTEGRLKMSRDGSLLFSTVQGGVRFVRLYDGLAAPNLSVSVDEGSSVPITLGGSIGNGGQLSWSIVQQPSSGALSGTPPNVTYTPNPGFYGPDSFQYKVSYGRAERTATVSIDVIHRSPTAVDDSAESSEGAPVTIDVLANDSDPDNDPLTVTSVTQGANGSVSINGDCTVTYSPLKAFNGTDSFTYTISDGTGRSDTATVTVVSTFTTTGLLYSVAVSPGTTAGGAAAKGTVKLSHALSLPIDVSLQTTNRAAGVPSAVTVTAGSVSATFAVTTTPVDVQTTGAVRALLGSDLKSVSFSVRPVSVKTITFSPSTVVGGRTSTGKVTLEAPAGPGDVTVALTSLSGLVYITDSSGNPVSSITILAGATTGAFTVHTGPVETITKANVRAAANGLYKEGTVTLKPIPLASIKLAPATVAGGQTSVATVTLLDPAAPGDVIVTLASSNSSVAWFVDSSNAITGSVVVPAGSKSVTVAVRTAPVASKSSVNLRASAGGVTKSAWLVVTP